MKTRILEEIGLTPGETKTYLALLKTGESSTGRIAKESQVSRSKLYSILDKLSKKGLVGSLKKGKINYFKAMEPRRILYFLEEKNKKFIEQREIIKKIIPELESKQRMEKTEATLYEGIKAIKNFYLNILDELSSGETYQVIGANYGENWPGIKEFFENYHKQRSNRGIKVKMLANHDAKNELVKTTFLNSEIRFLPQYLMSNMTIVFYKDKSFIFFLSENPIGLLMKNEESTKGFQSYFNAFWKIAKK